MFLLYKNFISKQTILTNLQSDNDYPYFKRKLLKISKNIFPGYDVIKVKI